ncbi:MAG: P1 family peptidase [Chloroflexi bacterium]|nr:P1 family peptidase [Chloroflexota bacterium]MBV9601553.1 P1 family peptidase [Chloroflexota bacterium]
MAALSIASVPGIRIGHWTDLQAATGCTVVLCERAVSVGVDVRGAAPATRETDLLRPGSTVGRAHAVLLTGGSAFGLNAATGVMRFLEERGVGVRMRSGVVPIVSAAALFDLGIGRGDVRPDAQAGYAACATASGAEVAEGSLGAGTGATVAKSRGLEGAIKGGIGSAARRLEDGTIVGALVAVNALGGIYEPATGRAIALARTQGEMQSPVAGENTTIGVIATTARLDSAGVNRLATLGHDGLALAIRPAHTLFDGDSLFAISLPTDEADLPQAADLLALGQAAAEVVAEAIVRGVRAATPLHGVPAVGK